MSGKGVKGQKKLIKLRFTPEKIIKLIEKELGIN